MTKFRLRELREEERMTQPQLAKMIGVNYRTIGHWENGYSEPDFEAIEKLCKIFGVTADYLLGIKND